MAVVLDEFGGGWHTVRGMGECEPAEVLLKAVAVLAVPIRGSDDLDLWLAGHRAEHHRAGAAQANDGYEQLDITGLTGVTEAQRPSLSALGAIEHAPTPRDWHAM